jgi:hypothetical protein
MKRINIGVGLELNLIRGQGRRDQWGGTDRRQASIQVQRLRELGQGVFHGRFKIMT